MTRLWAEGEAVEAWGGADVPDGFRWQGTAHEVATVCNRWQIHTLWWRPPQGDGSEGAIWRAYVKVITSSGLLCLLYHDLPDGGWFLARVYD